jgi:hypothetical protein
MSLNNLKKMIIFSNDRIKAIVERMVSDEATVEKRSASALIEKHILNDLLPENPNAAMWLQLLYDGSWGIGEVLEACFADLSAGVYWQAKHDNALDIVKFAHHWECMANNMPNTEANEMHHFLSQLDSVVTKLENIAKEATSGQYEAQKEAKWAKDLYNIAKDEPEYMRFSNIYQLLLNNWEQLKNWSITYRLLADMVAMQKNWRNSEETRYELTQLLTTVSAEWND